MGASQNSLSSTSQLSRRSASGASNPRAPCPSGNGTRIGNVENFTALCGVDLIASDSGQAPADNLTHCADQCAQFHHPRCIAVVYEASQAHGTQNCYFKAAASSSALPSPTVQPFVIDAAVAVLGPAPADDCSTIGGTYAKNGTSFKLYCGLDYPRDDLAMFFAGSMQACMDICITFGNTRAPCAGVSYEAAQLNGYLNCYLKSAVSTSGLKKEDPPYVIDSAFVVSSSGASSSGTGTTPTSAGPTSFTSPGGATTTTQGLVPASPSPVATSASTSSWIAGAVVGPVAGVALIGCGILMLIRRRKRSAASVSQLPPPMSAYPQDGHTPSSATYSPQYPDGSNNTHAEMYGDRPKVIELYASQPDPHELP